jgi:hypothetical protein
MPMADDGDRGRRRPYLMGGEKSIAYCRTTRIVADAAGAILRRRPAEFAGNAVLVEDILAGEGITDLSSYSAKPGQSSFFPDFFVDPGRLDQPVDALPEDAKALRAHRHRRRRSGLRTGTGQT